MPLTGDFSGLGQLERNLGKLARIPARASAMAAENLRELLSQEFDEGADPYGNAWAPLADATLEKGREEPPLTDTRELRDTLDVTPMPGSGVAITFDVPYAIPHQTGFRNARTKTQVPARPILPSNNMPARWTEAIAAACEAAFSAEVA